MLDPPHREELARLTEAFRAQRDVPGVVAGVVVGDELVWAGGTGSRGAEDGSVPDERTEFPIASLTKTFTATAIVQLRDDGLLDLNDMVVAHLPELAAVTSPFGPIEQVTLRLVLQHLSGLQAEVPNRDPREWTRMTTPEVIAALGEATLVLPPGERFKYSNLGYRLLGEIASRKSGVDFWTYLTTEILAPLGMPDTHPLPVDDVGGEGGLVSTIADLARWAAQQLRTDPSLERAPGQILRGTSLQELQRQTLLIEAWNRTRGLGWFGWQAGEVPVLTHGGHIPGFSSSLCVDRANGIGAVVLANGIAREPNELCRDLLDVVRPLVDAPAARPEAEPAARTTPVRDEWADLLGRYEAGGWSHADVVPDGDGSLALVVPLEGRLGLRSSSDALRFTVGGGLNAGEAVRFYRGANGAIDGLNLAGIPFVRTRQDA